MYNNSMRRFFIFIIICSTLLAGYVSAMVFDPADFTYVIHLYYDGKKFVPNSGSRFQYDIIGENFEQPAIATEKPYNGKLVSVKGTILASFVFDPKYVDSPVGRGPVEVKAPYFANAKSINLFDDTGQLILTINVGETLVCNENNICDSEVGEDFLACPSDCKAQIPITPVITDTPVPEEGDGSMMKLVLILGAILLGGIVAWLIIKKRRKHTQEPQSGITPPPVSGPPSTMR